MHNIFWRGKATAEEPRALKTRAKDRLSRTISRAEALDERADQIAEYFEDLDQQIASSFASSIEVIGDYQKAAHAQLLEHSSADRKFQSSYETQVCTTLLSLQSAFQLFKSLKRLHAQSPPALASVYRRFSSAASQKFQPQIEGMKRLRRLLPETIRTKTPPHQRMIYFPLQVIHRPINSLQSRKLRFGSYGHGPMQFMDPRGIAVHPITGDVYICESANSVVRRFSSDLKYVDSVKYGVHSVASGFMDIAISNSGRVLVLLNSAQGRIEFVEQNGGAFPEITKTVAFDTRRVNLGRATFDEYDNLYVSSPDGRAIHKYAVDGKLLMKIVQTQTFKFDGPPEGLLVNDSGELFVSFKTSTVQVFDSKIGTLIRSFQVEKIQGSSCISYGPEGTLMITDSVQGQIMFYLPTGKLRRIIDVYRACAAKFDSRGNLIVVQCSDSNSVEVY